MARNKCVFNKRGNRYIYTIETKDTKLKNKLHNIYVKEESNIQIHPLEDTEVTELRDILKHKDTIINLLENKPVIKPNDIDISALSGDLKVKTLKIYDSVLKEFNEFIKIHKEFKQQDIVSLALKEF